MRGSDISTRMKHVIRSSTEESRRFKRLEDELGVGASSWKSWWHGRQRATEEMVQAVCKRWPQYAFWITTGLDDAKYGHAAPAGHGFPSDAEEQPSSTRYFAELVALRDTAMKLVPEWLNIDDAELSEEFASDDNALRAVVGDWTFTDQLLSEREQRVQVASKLRDTEIALHSGMQNLDFDETAVVLKALERAHQELVNRAGRPTDMAEEFALNTEAIEKMKQRIENYRRPIREPKG